MPAQTATHGCFHSVHKLAIVSPSLQICEPEHTRRRDMHVAYNLKMGRTLGIAPLPGNVPSRLTVAEA